jgi:mannose-1-phosphate guanylyltransferase
MEQSMEQQGQSLWAIILAAGEGTRLASLTRALYGTDLPKQFAVLTGTRSMLQDTVDRVLPLAPPSRIVVVVGRGHEALAREQLAAWSPEINILVQPRNLDTGPGLLLPLAWIRARDRDARVAVFPADHHVSRPAVLRSTIELAAFASHLAPARVVLLGAEPDQPDTEYGWIVPGRRLTQRGIHAVRRFVEKPPEELAEELHRMGALWNTFIMVGSVRSLWELGRRYLPEHAERLARCIQGNGRDLEPLYSHLSAANFSRVVLERARNLALVPLRGAGWSDWGTPRRVFQCLEGTPAHRELLGRIAADRPAAHGPRASWSVEPADRTPARAIASQLARSTASTGALK